MVTLTTTESIVFGATRGVRFRKGSKFFVSEENMEKYKSSENMRYVPAQAFSGRWGMLQVSLTDWEDQAS